jgi:pterin-4a-carbinolamine dehydratase
VKENNKCKFGEENAITKEVWCNKYKEFCKFINKCKEK